MWSLRTMRRMWLRTPSARLFTARGGMVSLRELAEEELLLALPVAPACSIPLTCGNAPDLTIDAPVDPEQEQMRRPFSALQDLLKKR